MSEQGREGEEEVEGVEEVEGGEEEGGEEGEGGQLLRMLAEWSLLPLLAKYSFQSYPPSDAAGPGPKQCLLPPCPGPPPLTRLPVCLEEVVVREEEGGRKGVECKGSRASQFPCCHYRCLPSLAGTQSATCS